MRPTGHRTQIGKEIKEMSPSDDGRFPMLKQTGPGHDEVPLSTKMEDSGHHWHHEIFISFTGSPNELQRDPRKTSWTILNASVFQHDGKSGPMGNVKRAFVISATGEAINNAFPFPVAIKIANTPQDMSSDSGACNYAAGPNSRSENAVLVRGRRGLEPQVFSAFADKDFSTIIAGLQEVDITDVMMDKNTGQQTEVVKQCYLVKPDNILIAVIKANKEKLGIQGEVKPAIGASYAIEKHLVDKVLSDIKNDILDKLPIFDFSQLEISIQRADGKMWDDPQGVSGIFPGDTTWASATACFSLRILFKYVLSNS